MNKVLCLSFLMWVIQASAVHINHANPGDTCLSLVAAAHHATSLPSDNANGLLAQYGRTQMSDNKANRE